MEYPSDGNLEKENDTKTRAPTPSLYLSPAIELEKVDMVLQASAPLV
jgi:hypothetical protein